MGTLLLALRIIHIVLGVFWAGTLMFVATFLEPAVRATAPEGGKVIQAMLARRYLDILPLIALLTILSGFALMWIVSGGFNPDWMGSKAGMILGTGGVVALAAFAIGVGIMRPATLKVMALAKKLPEAGAGAEAIQAEMAGLRRRAAVAGRWVAALLLLAVTTMAVARYA